MKWYYGFWQEIYFVILVDEINISLLAPKLESGGTDM